MVPGSTLRYGSSFWMVTATPRLLSSRPIDAVAMPLPTELTTPPVTKMYLVVIASLLTVGAYLSHNSLSYVPGVRNH